MTWYLSILIFSNLKALVGFNLLIWSNKKSPLRAIHEHHAQSNIETGKEQGKQAIRVWMSQPMKAVTEGTCSHGVLVFSFVFEFLMHCNASVDKFSLKEIAWRSEGMIVVSLRAKAKATPRLVSFSWFKFSREYPRHFHIAFSTGIYLIRSPFPRWVQLSYLRTTAFSQVGLFLNTPFQLKSLFPEACVVFIADFCLVDEFDFSLCDVRFSADEEDVRGSSYCGFSFELLLSM